MRRSSRYCIGVFVNRIYRHAQENPDRLAAISDGEEYTYGDFARAIEAVRNHLVQEALPDHGVILRLDRNLYLDWVMILAIRSLGLTVTSGPSWETMEGMNIGNITGVVCFSAEEPALAPLRSARPDLAIGVVPLSTIQRSASTSVPSLLPDSRFGDQIIYTSGTTAGFKKIVGAGDRFNDDIMDNYFRATDRMIAPGDYVHCQRFQNWSGPGNWTPIVCWSRGATAIFDERDDWIEHFNDYPVGHTFVAPGILAKFETLMASRPEDYPPLKLEVGGGFVAGKFVDEMIDAPGVELYVAYGGTEFGTAAQNAVHVKDDLVWLMPTSYPEIEIVDDNDRIVPIGTEGNIRIKLGPYDPSDYLDEPEATALHFRNGHFYPGDMAVKREDGRIRILGRVQDVLNLGGHKIPVGPVEESIRQSLGLENVCVFAVQDVEGEERLAVVIEARQFPDGAELKAAVEQAVKAPRCIVLKMDHFPRGENGMMKVNRRKVLEYVRATWKG